AKIPCKKPLIRQLRGGDRFVSDCAHHHPVFPNRVDRLRSRIGPFCRDLVTFFQRCRSLAAITVSRVDFWPAVSASKNSVPGDLNLGRNGPAREPLASS